MKYLYKDRIAYFKDKKMLLEWCEEEKAFLQNIETGEKQYVEMVDISTFTWIKNKIKWTLKIDRSTKKISKEKVWKKYKFEEVEECFCTLSSEKI